MSVKIPIDLKNKLINCEGNLKQSRDSIDVTMFGESFKNYIPGLKHIEFEIETWDVASLQACQDWFESGECIDIGPFVNVRPTDMIMYYTDVPHCAVTFEAANFDLKKGNWRDWFIQEDTTYEQRTN